MVFEEDLKTALPRFDEEVCVKYEHQFFPTLLTAVALGCLPPLHRGAVCRSHKDQTWYEYKVPTPKPFL
jgi:hypothetical protein